ncbi:hypothetical protein LX36DRAFT_344893 [Colletotrichum falcatum]|nr:hypothetical protein LX36DRAFT_344893 [Colletotrichum falcatum]
MVPSDRNRMNLLLPSPDGGVQVGNDNGSGERANKQGKQRGFFYTPKFDVWDGWQGRREKKMETGGCKLRFRPSRTVEKGRQATRHEMTAAAAAAAAPATEEKGDEGADDNDVRRRMEVSWALYLRSQEAVRRNCEVNVLEYCGRRNSHPLLLGFFVWRPRIRSARPGRARQIGSVLKLQAGHRKGNCGKAQGRRSQ